MSRKKKAYDLAKFIEDHATDPIHSEAAKMMRKLADIADVAAEVVRAKTHDHSKAAYAELVDLIKGKPSE
jgi:hypothetical protein